MTIRLNIQFHCCRSCHGCRCCCRFQYLCEIFFSAFSLAFRAIFIYVEDIDTYYNEKHDDQQKLFCIYPLHLLSKILNSSFLQFFPFTATFEKQTEILCAFFSQIGKQPSVATCKLHPRLVQALFATFSLAPISVRSLIVDQYLNS